MSTSDRDVPRSPAAELFVHIVWPVGALISYFAGAAFTPVAAMAGLATTAGLVLLLARLSTGWRAVPTIFAALAVQAALMLGLGLYALRLPVGHHPWPHLCFWWHGTNLELIAAVLLVVVLSSPIGFFVRLEQRGLDRLRWFARWAAPAAVVASAVLVVLGSIRFSRFPTADHYVESLPVHTVIQDPTGQPCALIEDRRDPKHDPGWEWEEQCATPEVDARPLSFHYHGFALEDGEPRVYSLHVRTKAGHDRDVGVWFGERREEVTVKRDDALDAWLIQYGRSVRVLTLNGPRWRLYVHQLRERVSPPLGWSLSAAGGLLVALACLGASLGLGSIAGGASNARREWVAARQGDLSLVALASAMCTSALLAAALFAGFLT